jgi:prophage antirepressor-like protein
MTAWPPQLAIRARIIGKETWWVESDVCKVLGLENPSEVCASSGGKSSSMGGLSRLSHRISPMEIQSKAPCGRMALAA